MNNVFIQVCILFASGLLFAKLAQKVKLPAVTGYLLGGLLVGPYVLNLVRLETVQNLSGFSSLALGFIAFSIGSEFKMSYFKKVGMRPVIIAIFEATIAALLVSLVLYFITKDIGFSLMVGALASATAPASTIMVIKQYRAKGPVTSTLLSVVAMDDAVALVCFGFALAITNSLQSENTHIVSMLLSPFVEIFLALLVGALIGVFLCYVLRFFHSKGNIQAVVLAIILGAIGLSQWVGASPLLTCMTFGAVFTNLSKRSFSVMEISEELTSSLYILFFVLSGSELNPSVIPSLKLVGVSYVLVRVVGKYLGSYLGAVLSKAEPSVRKYLGPCLIPQAGVAIGLSLIAERVVPEYGSSIRAIILCATLIYELIGPWVTKITLQKAKEIVVE